MVEPQTEPIPGTDTALHRPLPELLAPAGDRDCARAAVENGADAIYFGLDRFNARMRAHNFTEADLPGLMEYLHSRGVRGYVTLNTLVFENELPDAEQYLRTMIAAGVDAVIVQDAGICRLIRELSPDFPIHASTQMTVTSHAGVEFARELGCNLVVLARECSIAEIEKIQAVQAPNLAIPLEVFVHGALCVAYSGQCLTSEALGGRSANRGECAQACRMPYELIADGHHVPLGDRRYLLSPQDLAGLDALPDLLRAGVASLKIEGRLKSPEYVANITRLYRSALQEFQRTTGPSTEPGTGAEDVRERRRYEMEMAFSRGLHTGWFRGVNNQQLVHARFGKKRGVFLGEVSAVRRDAVWVRAAGPMKAGDGIVFDAGRPEENEEGGRIYEVRPTSASGMVELRFGRGDIDFSRVSEGDKLWKTDDPDLNRRLRQTFQTGKPQFRRPIDMEVHGADGKPLTVIVRDEIGNIASADSAVPLAVAQTQPLTTQRLREQLGRLGDTAFELRELRNELSNGLMLPIRELNRLRRETAGELERLRRKPPRWTLRPRSSGPIPAPRPFQPATEPRLIVLVRTLAQLDAALRCDARTIYCDFENPKRYRDAVNLFHTGRGCNATPDSDSGIFVAPPRIFKMGEEWTLKQVRSSDADGYLVRNYDHLKFFKGQRCIGDFSLNIANHLSADTFRNRCGLERVTASYDLNFQQLESLLKAAPPEWFEITVHQHMPMFHMEHCVFCAFLSEGTDYTNCGRPCDHHDLKLRDRVGAEHPVKADVGCRNTVFQSLAQTGAEYVERMMALGARHFRIEFVNETPEQVASTIARYRRLLRGEMSGAQLWRELKLLNQLGVTRGRIRD